jgi:hypothetical protein
MHCYEERVKGRRQEHQEQQQQQHHQQHQQQVVFDLTPFYIFSSSFLF